MTRKILLLLLIFISFSNISAQVLSNEVADLISKCYDLAYSGLDQEAKTQLIEAIHNKQFSKYEATLRFSLGQICYFNKEMDGAIYQWGIVAYKYPQSEEAVVIKLILDIANLPIEQEYDDILFSEEYNLSKYMWRPKRPNTRIDLQELNDPLLAIEYLKDMLGRYEDCTKKSIIVYDLFLLYMGYNNDDFGFHNVRGNFETVPGPSLEYYKQKMKYDKDGAISIRDNDSKIPASDVKDYLFNESESLSNDLKEMTCASYYYVRTQFLLGVSLSGTKLFSTKINLQQKSIPYFENVVKAAEGDQINIYRIFAIKWLAILKNKK